MASPSNHRNSHNGAPGTLPDAMPPAEGINQGAELFLSNYRLGKTLGIGSFGKVLSRSLRGMHVPSVVGQFFSLHPEQQLMLCT